MIYLDNHSTTPMDPEVFKTMEPYFLTEFGNAASKHSFGWTAGKAVEVARSQIARLINAQPKEIIFTSGATESNCMALLGIAESYRSQGNHIITSNIEHKSVLDCCLELEARGFKITRLPVDQSGKINPEQVLNALTPETILVSLQMANNEVGTIQPIKEIGKELKGKNIFFHTDAVQGLGLLKVDVQELNVDLISLSAHKIYGPKGVGALFVRNQSPRIKIKPRSGTLNVPGIVGFGKACELVEKNRTHDFEKVKSLRDQLEKTLEEKLKVKINGHRTDRLPNNLNISFEEITDVNDLLKEARNLAMSTGSACSTAQIEPSHVLTALGLDETMANRTLRIGLGRFNTEMDISDASKTLVDACLRLGTGQLLSKTL